MRLFTIDNNGKLIPYQEHIFGNDNRESDLEILLEKNPEYFFEKSKILIIGRQVQTNLGSWIDLLGLDQHGNTVVVELKRGKTPRETLAQLLEYASFIENLDYESLNEIYQGYVGEDTSLDNYHQEFFDIDSEEQVSFNKSTKLVIVAQDISAPIKQTALYLRKKGFDIYCMEFKYFLNHASEKMITCDFVVGDENFIKREIQSATQLPKVDEDAFMESLDSIGKPTFTKLFEFAKKHGLFFRWGSKGFSLNLNMDNGFVGLCFGYPPESVFKQSIYSGLEEINKKVETPDEIIRYYRESLEQTGFFQPAKNNLKWLINKNEDIINMDKYIDILTELIVKIKSNGLKMN